MREARPPGKGQSRRAHRAEPKRHDSLFRALIATAVDGIVVIDERGGIQVFNAACEKLFGYSAQDVLGQNVNVLMPEPYRSSHDSYLTHFRETGEERIIGIGREVRGRHKTGETFPMYLSVGEGEIEGERFFVGIIHDLTAIRTEEERGLALDRHLASIVESSDDIILSKDLDGTILTWNQAATQIFGWTAAEMIGASIERIIPEDRRDEEKQMVSRIRAGGKVDHFETVRVRKDGSQVAVSLSISPVRDAKGTIVGASKIARDITAQRRAEAEKQRLQAELAHVARTNAMGQLSSALAHELNQPLTASMNYVNAARQWLSTGANADKVPPLLAKAVEQTVRAGQIIQRLRSFLEKREPARAPENLNTVVREAVALGAVGMVDDDIVLKLDLAAHLPEVMADRVQIQQVVVNLIRNAGEAMHGRPLRKLTVRTWRGPEDGACVSIADTGPGLAEEVAARLFEPFVSTKQTGMGVGLSICRTILEAHEGRIWMTPTPGGGATFHFQLPPRIVS